MFSGIEFDTGPKIPQCKKCGRGASPSPVYGGPGQGILFVASHPSAQDIEDGEPFSSASNKVFRDACRAVGISLTENHTTYAVRCAGKAPTDAQALCCRPHFLTALEETSPRVIVPVDETALRMVLSGIWKKDFGPFTTWTGYTIPVPDYAAWVCPVVSKSQIYKAKEHPVLVAELTQQLRTALQRTKKPLPKVRLDDLKKKVQIYTDPHEGGKRMMELSKQSGLLAWDYETTGLKPDSKEQKIYSVSFCLNGKDTFATLITPDNMPALSAVLRSPLTKKIASNMKFEERWTMAKLGHRVKNWCWDTMLAAHLGDNRGRISSIKFQSFVRYGIGDYDSEVGPFLTSAPGTHLNRIYEANPVDVLIYNGLDSLLEYMVARDQVREMQDDSED